MEELNIKHFAHIGDSCWELYVRSKTIYLTGNLNKLHNYTVALVNASFQTKVVEYLKPYLTEEESDLVRRGSNIKTARRFNKNLHRIATGLEVLTGYLYLNNKERLNELKKITDEFLEDEILELTSEIIF